MLPFRLAMVGTLVAAVSCGPPPRETMQSRAEAFADDSILFVALKDSPSSGTKFSFCPRPSSDAPVNLTNAAWLAFMAANEYSHLHYLADALDQLGFETPDGSGFVWSECAVDLRVLRGFENAHSSQLSAARKQGATGVRDYLAPFAKIDAKEPWGECARRWFDDSGYDGTRYPAASFEKYLIQTAHAGHYLQFFSGGEFVLEGRAFAVGSTQVLFARHKELPILIISFRGTEPNKWRDIVTDGKAWKVKLTKHGWPAAWGSVHSGFYAAFESIGEALRQKLAEFEDAEVGIWITGHSLGGGLATLMAAEVLRQNAEGKRYALRGVYTFGSPRVGNNDFHDRFTADAARANVRVVRFRNGDDAVTAIPRVLEYKHVGTLAYLEEGALRFPEAEPGFSGVGSIADHNMTGWDTETRPVSGYYRRLRDLLRLQPPDSRLTACEPR